MNLFSVGIFLNEELLKLKDAFEKTMKSIREYERRTPLEFEIPWNAEKSKNKKFYTFIEAEMVENTDLIRFYGNVSFNCRHRDKMPEKFENYQFKMLMSTSLTYEKWRKMQESCINENTVKAFFQLPEKLSKREKFEFLSAYQNSMVVFVSQTYGEIHFDYLKNVLKLKRKKFFKKKGLPGRSYSSISDIADLST